LLLTGCESEPVKKQTHLTVAPPVKLPNKPVADSKNRSHSTAQANIQTHRLTDDNNALHLMQANSLLQTGDIQAAQKQLDLLNQSTLTPEQIDKRELLTAQIDLSMGNAEQALQHLAKLRPSALSADDPILYYQSLAFAHTLTGHDLSSIVARIRLGALLPDEKQQYDNIASILDALSVLSNDALTSQPAPLAAELEGWMRLAQLLKQRQRLGTEINDQLQQWRQNYPNHPANAQFLRNYLATPPVVATNASPTATTAPQSTNGTIAILLPGSGGLAAAGKAIKQGLQAAYRLSSASAPQPPLKFYDSEQGAIGDIYRQALADGAKQVIGPLTKEQIQALGESNTLSVPVLALNHVEGFSKPNLYQFGLSPIDEAEQLALKAWRDGQRSMAMLLPNNGQGQRVGYYLNTVWQRSGGTITANEQYDAKNHDLGAALERLLASIPSTSGQMPKLSLFLSASPEVARELAPLLKSQQRADISVYAMPNLYSGRLNPGKDSELGNMQFCDLPWLFADVYGGALSQSALQQSWQDLPESHTRLFALGLDAYQLIGKLDQLANTPFSGATGKLGLNAEYRITRKLACAQFKGGMPVTSGYLDTP